MPKAIKPHNTPQPDFSDALSQIRSAVARSGDALLLANGPPHADAALLELCADALFRVTQAERAWTEFETLRDALHAEKQRRDPTLYGRMHEKYLEAEQLRRSCSPLLRKAKKLRSTTAAGVFAKALLVRSSRTGATDLAMSLADELIACEGLRSSLWPAAECL